MLRKTKMRRKTMTGSFMCAFNRSGTQFNKCHFTILTWQLPAHGQHRGRPAQNVEGPGHYGEDGVRFVVGPVSRRQNRRLRVRGRRGRFSATTLRTTTGVDRKSLLTQTGRSISSAIIVRSNIIIGSILNTTGVLQCNVRTRICPLHRKETAPPDGEHGAPHNHEKQDGHAEINIPVLRHNLVVHHKPTNDGDHHLAHLRQQSAEAAQELRNPAGVPGVLRVREPDVVQGQEVVPTFRFFARDNRLIWINWGKNITA